jgi:predicted PurR-regulated permease PerM
MTSSHPPIENRPPREQSIENKPPAWRDPPSPPRSWWWVTSAGAAALALGLGIAAFVWLMARPIGLLVLGVSLAALLAPLVSWLERWLPRTLAILLIYLGLLLLAGGIGLIIIPPIANQMQMLLTRLPTIFDQAQQWLNKQNLVVSNQLINLLSSQVSGSIGTLVNLSSAILSPILDVILIFFVSIYGLILAPSVRDFLLSLFPERRQAEVNDLLKRIVLEMGGYLRGAMINGLIIGALTTLGLFIIGVDFPLVLGLLAGVLELVPFIGPIIASIPIVLIGLLSSPTIALIALIYVAALHQLESQILVPNIMRSQTDVSPLLVLLAFSAGYTIAGPFGALVAIPLTAGLRVLLLDSLVPAIRQRLGSDEASKAKEVQT